jgi:hypothetical protein
MKDPTFSVWKVHVFLEATADSYSNQKVIIFLTFSILKMLIFNKQVQKLKMFSRDIYAYSISTVKAPNFDRVFMENIFLLHNFVRWAPLKKIDQACKIKVLVVLKSKFWFWNP